MRVSLLGDKVEIIFPYSPAMVELIKTLGSRQYAPKRKSWTIPLAGAFESVEKLKRWGFNIDEAVELAVRQDAERGRQAEALAEEKDTPFESSLPLFPYQKVGARFISTIGSGLIGDEPGMGKTVESLAVVEDSSAKSVLIFCPSAVKYQWAEEIKKFIPTDNSVMVVDGAKEERIIQWRSGVRFFVANYELLLRDFLEMDTREWGCIIADEATKIANPHAKQSRAIKRLRARDRIALTGTPISNRAQEVWSIIDFCRSGAFGSYYDFMNRYCVKNQWGGVFGYQNTDELRAKLKRFMIRRTKKEVLPDLPEKIITDIPFLLCDTEKELYNKIKQEILFEIKEADIAKIENPMTIQMALVKMLRLRQLCDSLELLGESKTSSKLEVLKELMREALEGNDQKAIVFTQFAEMADILERELRDYKPLKISGKVSDDYHNIVRKFNEIEDYRVLVMTSAGQFGLNIQRASVVFHYDQEWSLAKMEQREGRAHRIGQKNSVQVFNLLAKGSMDMYVRKVLRAKRSLSDQILGDTPLTMGDIKQMLMYDETS
jgi:SNF2 family DNA or RNA helicase